MGTLNIVAPGLAGASEAFVAAAAGGDQFSNSGHEMLHFKNTGGSAITVTVASQKNCSHGVNHPITLVVPATTGDKWLGPFAPDRFNDVNGFVQITYSAVTGLTVSVVQGG